eukprot:scaffold9004_cov107-Cylindrotheca_fusiformis.AAC.5
MEICPSVSSHLATRAVRPSTLETGCLVATYVLINIDSITSLYYAYQLTLRATPIRVCLGNIVIVLLPVHIPCNAVNV